MYLLNILHFLISKHVSSKGALVVKNLLAKAGAQEMRVRPLGREDPLRRAWQTPLQYSCLGNPVRTEESGQQSIRPQRAGHDQSNLAHTHTCLKPTLQLGRK